MSNRTIQILLVENDAATLDSARALLPSSVVSDVESLSAALEKVAAQTSEFVLLGPQAAQALLWEGALRTQEHTAELAQAIEALREQVLDTQRIEAEIRRENQELAILNSIPAAVSTSLDLTEVLLLLKQQLSQQLGVPGGCIYVYEQQSEKFELKESWGLPDEVTAILTSIPAKVYPANEILRSRKPFLVAEIKKDRLYHQLGIDQTRPDWQSCLGVPVLADGVMQGVVVLFSPSIFNDAQISFYTSFGRQVGAACFYCYRTRSHEQCFSRAEN